MSYVKELTVIDSIQVYTCCHEGCGVPFGMTSGYVSMRRDDHNWFYCPNGHRQHFSGDNEKEKLEKQVQSLETRLNNAWSVVEDKKIQIQQLNYSVRAQKAAKTKIMNRVKHGVCPCCRRSFQNLQNHFKTQHPDLLTKAA